MSTAATRAGGTGPRLLVGAAKRDVTPNRLTNLDPRGGDFTGVHDPLHVRAVVLEDESTLLAIVGIDAIEVGDARELAQRVEQETGIPAEHLFVVGTHTHSAPRIGRVSPGALALASRPEFDAFTRDVADAVIDVLGSALARRRSATVAFGTGSVDVNVNRDLLVDGVWRSGRNDEGPSDKTLTAVRFSDPDGRPIAAFLSYAVHSTVTFGTGEVSADLAGAAATHLEGALGPESVVVWLPGALGDQDPRARFEDAANAPDAIRFAYEALAAQAHLIGAEAERVIARAQLCSGLPQLVVRRRSFDLPAQAGQDDRDDMTFAGATSVRLPVGVVLLHDIALCTAGGEVVTEIADAIRSSSPLTRTVVVSLVDDRIGYLTTDEAYGRPTFESLRSPVRRGHAERALVEGFADLVGAGLAARVGGGEARGNS